MASKLSLAFLLLVFLSILSQPTISIAVQTNHHDHGLNVGMISSPLSNKGLHSHVLNSQTNPLTLILSKVTHNTTITIFCPLDKDFLSSNYLQPPFTLLQYHVASLKLDREARQSTVPYESKFDNLLPQRPFVVTTTRHHSDRTSINGVKVTYWDIYNDGHVIVHRVEDFFDLAIQTLLYPWYNGRLTKNENENRTGKDSNIELGRLSSMKEMMMME
ncbi:uncharacterized protein LOC114319333 [Camellia sinensis]|uniref:uncharacterized protein LOC114319333 n=1 Tax=Camellia sinensis TaxID=4442 RepID=UPI0010362D69|nr:uncharacterized protein LOC114319333 [Camellia sinensis]